MNSKNWVLILFLACTMPVFAQEADMSLIPYREGDKWGFANPERNIVIEPAYEEVDLFYEGYASAKKTGKYGYLNKEGKVVIPFKFFLAKPFRYGYFEKAGNANAEAGSLNNQKTVLFAGASLQANGYEICIDTKGTRMPKCPAISESSAPDINKATTVTVVSNYSTMQKSELYDKIVGDYKMPGAEDSYYIAMRNNKHGVFNKVFEVIVPFEYDKIEKVNFGVMPYLLVEKDGLKGIMFGNGSLYMAVENSKLEYVRATDENNYIIFTKDGKTGIKNSKYKVLAQPVYTNIEYHTNGGFILTGEDNLKGFCFLNNNILEPGYAAVSPVKGGKYVLIKTVPGGKSKESGEITEPSKMGYINHNLVKFFTD